MIHPADGKENGSYVHDITQYHSWSSEQITAFLKSRGVPVGNNVIEHKIAGDLLDDMTEDDYGNLGYESVGDKIRVSKAIIQLLNERKVYPTYHAYWMHRWEISNVRKYYMGVDLTLDEADAVVNSLALVNALILTIPFGIIMGLSSDYWTTLRNDLVAYGGSCNGRDYDYGRSLQLNMLYGCAYSSMSTLLLCIFYYILRPKFVYFPEWWRRAKYCVLMTFGGSVTSIACMLTLFGSLAEWFTYNPDDMCEDFDINSSKYATGVTFLGAFCLVSVLLMV